MQISYQLTAEDYRHAFYAFRNRNSSLRLRNRIMLVVAGLCLGLLIAGTIINADTPAGTVVVLLILLYWGYCRWYAPRMIGRKMMAGPGASGARTVEISENGMHDRTEVSDSKMTWNLFVGWNENNEVFALFPSAISFLPVPKRAMTTEQQDEFRTLLQKYVRP